MLAGFNDLVTLLPDIATEWSDRNYPSLPTQVTVFANRKAYVRGCAALLDAVGQAINKIDNVQKHLPEEHCAGKVLFVITTGNIRANNAGCEK